jgi:uncharacterized membrane protein YccF (DUF307 family)
VTQATKGKIMAFILNILWFVLGGWAMGLGWLVAALLMAITIIGLPWSIACLRIAGFAAWPFGRVVVRADEMSGDPDDVGGLVWIGNAIWFVFAGWWLALSHLLTGAALALTIIGIPFAFQHLKLAQLSLFPLGRQVVDADVADAIRWFNRA